MAYLRMGPRQLGAERSMSVQGAAALQVIDIGAGQKSSDRILNGSRRVDPEPERRLINTPQQHSRTFQREWFIRAFFSSSSSEESSSPSTLQSETSDEETICPENESHYEHLDRMNRLAFSPELRRLISQDHDPTLCGFRRMALVEEAMKEIILMEQSDFDKFKATFPNIVSPVIWDTIQRHRRIVAISGKCMFPLSK